MDTQTSRTKTDERAEALFAQLLNRLEDGLAVPFLGAGISASARVPGRPDFKPSVAWLNKQLAEMLLPKLRGEEAWRTRLAASTFPDARLHCSVAKDSEKERKAGTEASAPAEVPKTGAEALKLICLDCLDDHKAAVENLVQAARNRLDVLAEAVLWVMSDEEKDPVVALCERLHIECFAKLEPTPAHVYLAYLAREGLITEILTTNYDTCVEVAFRRSFHPDEANDRCSEGSATENDRRPSDPELHRRELKVIRDLREYREKGGTRWVMVDSRTRPVLRLFKINGCASRYRDERARAEAAERAEAHNRAAEIRRAVADSIILTERQLQTFRGQQWARDLFRDRARCNGLVFSGYGSEEPQIRHTALALMKEWDGHDGRCWWQPNAPFMAAYTEELTFTQYQLMRGYAESHACGRCDKKAECNKHNPRNCFTAKNREWFGGEIGGKEAVLSADLFWKRVFQASFLRLVERACRRPGPFYTWIHAHVRSPALDIGNFLAWLGGPRSTMWSIQWLLLDLENKKTLGPLPLSKWLMAMRGNLKRWEQADERGYPYMPVREHPLLVVGALFLVYRLAANENSRSAQDLARSASVPKSTDPQKRSAGEATTKDAPVSHELGVRVSVVSLECHAVYLVTDDWTEDDECGTKADETLVRQIVLPALARLKPESRIKTGASRGSLRMGRFVRIPAEKIVGLPSGDKAALLRAFAEYDPAACRARLVRISPQASNGNAL